MKHIEKVEWLAGIYETSTGNKLIARLLREHANRLRKSPTPAKGQCSTCGEFEPYRWQPIETCPDDTRVLLYSPWLHETNPAAIEVREFRNSRGGTQHSYATHWMSLPEAPKNDK